MKVMTNTITDPPFYPHGTCIRWLLRICLARMSEKGLFGEKKIRFVTGLDLIKCLTQINNRDCSLRTYLFLSYHLM